MRRRLPSLSAAALLALSGAPALASTVSLPPPDAVTHQRAAGDYRIGPQDTLDINVSQVEELSKPVQVDTGGKILLPLVGQIQAAGRTPGELSQDLAVALKKHYMKDPQVVVSVKESQSQKVTIDGAVGQPGVYALAGPTTLMQAVSLAHGADPKLANLHKVAIFRTIGGERRSAFYDLSQIRSGRAEDPPVYGSDIVVVDTSGTKNFFQNFQGGFGLLGMLVRPW
ncbi:MAG: gumB [Phenylobacterium sp.]|nr:gumB [Phenylobacterium sp.]